MRKIEATKFKEHCLSLLKTLEPEGILITKHGKPVAWLLPANLDCAELIGCMKDKIQVHGDISSTDTRWSAEK